MTAHYTYSEAASRLRVPIRWLQRNISRLPHSKKGRVVTFSDQDLDRIDALHHHEPAGGPLALAPPPRTTGAHPMAHLRPLPQRGAARRSA